MVEKRAQEQKLAEEKKHGEEINFLKRTNQQLKVRVLKTFNCLSSIFVLIWKILKLKSPFFSAKFVHFFHKNAIFFYNLKNSAREFAKKKIILRKYNFCDNPFQGPARRNHRTEEISKKLHPQSSCFDLDMHLFCLYSTVGPFITGNQVLI